MTNFSRGSEWRKWDLHVHSPLSILNNQFPKLTNGTPDWEPYLEKLESLDFAVLGVTDYFTIDGYKALKEFQATGRLPDLHCILPNVEFRLNTIVTSKSGSEKRLNLHVIFSDEVPPNDIEEHFLHDLPFFYQGDPQNQIEKRKLKLSNLEGLGRELKKQHEKFRQMGSDLEVGAMLAVVDIDDIVQALRDSRFEGKYLIILAADGWDDINWDGQGHMVRKGLLQQSDQVFSANPKTRSWCLGINPYDEGTEHFIREFKTLKPCIHGSDAHSINDIGRPCALRGDAAHDCDRSSNECEMRFCWLKADPSFEGLKQLLYEPDERVKIQTLSPAPIISNYSIARVVVQGNQINDELAIDDTDLVFNTSLVAIVGGKGAGKTALVDLIANNYRDRSTSDDKNSFVRRISEYDVPVETILEFRDGEIFKKVLGDGNFVEESQLIYIAQGELESYIGEASDLSSHITDLILHSPHIENSASAFEFETSAQETGSIERQLTAGNTAIDSLHKKTSADVANKLEQEKKRVAADLSDVATRIKEFEKVQSQQSIDVAQKRQAVLGDLKALKDDLVALEETIQTTVDTVAGSLEEINQLVEAANELLKMTRIQESLPRIEYPGTLQLASILKTVKQEIKDVIPKIEKGQKELQTLERGVKDHAKLLERQRELKKEEKTVEDKLKVLKEDGGKLINAENQQCESLKELLQSVLKQKESYEAIIKTFSADKAIVLSDIDFVAEVKLDSQRFLDDAGYVVDNRRVDLQEVFSDFINASQAVALGEEKQIDNVANEAAKSVKTLKEKLKAKVSINRLFDLLFSNYMTVVPVVKYKKTNLDKLSLGQKATVLIKIYLAYGDKPIVIDSHDDHLDNEFIMLELVNAIKEAKRFRQVILVSNNGNVVINSDAEQIVLASRENGKIKYVSGSIENPDIRDSALNVLEGGKEAFRQRQQKYRLGS
jgi:ABC-type cobalamin/Fe3+-siderophores transport system ATPase subunit